MTGATLFETREIIHLLGGGEGLPLQKKWGSGQGPGSGGRKHCFRGSKPSVSGVFEEFLEKRVENVFFGVFSVFLRLWRTFPAFVWGRRRVRVLFAGDEERVRCLRDDAREDRVSLSEETHKVTGVTLHAQATHQTPTEFSQNARHVEHDG